MQKQTQTINKVKLVLSAAGILVICLSGITIAGFFTEGGTVGNTLSEAMQMVMGKFAWFGPFLTAAMGFALILYRPKKKPQKPLAPESDNIPKAARGELISKGPGFNNYFSDDDPLNEHKNTPEPFTELEDVGKDFKSYFGSQGNNVKLVSMGQRITDYFPEDEIAAAAAEETVEEEPEAFLTQVVNRPKGGLLAFIRNTSPPPKPGEQLGLDIIEATPPLAQLNKSVVPRPTLTPKEITLPPRILLDPPAAVSSVRDSAAVQNAQLLEEVLNNFGVKVKVTDISQGPAITRYEILPAPGIKISRVVSLADDMALALAARDVRIEAPIPGKSAIGIEVPNKQVNPVKFREVLESDEFRPDAKLQVALGKDIAGKPIVADLTRMPHLLVAGATGSGKSVCMNTIITSVLYSAFPEEVKLLLIDPKMVELTRYNGIPHLIAPVVTDPKKAAAALRWVVNEMETRYELFAGAGVRDILRYNEINPEQRPLPYIVVLIDELADLMMVAPGDVEEGICRLAQMARAAGIHLVVATQRPSVDVITGIIKANIPSRIAFAVSSQIDSRTILDGTGAEKLLGKGDMLYYPLGMTKPLRVQGCLLSDQEVEQVVNHWKSQSRPEYLQPNFEDSRSASEAEAAEDELFYEAGKLFITTGMASVSLLQRRLRVGYTRAARLMDLLEQQGVVGGFEGSKPRQVVLSISEFEERFG